MTSAATRIYLIIPAYNERENMPRLMESLRAMNRTNNGHLHIILVDDGSSDGTAEAARNHAGELSLHIIALEHNRGPGGAFAAAFSYLHQRLVQGDIVVTMEGDNTSRLATLEVMLGRLLRENQDCAFASVYAYGGGFMHTSWWRILLSHGASFLTKLMLNIHGIHTFTSFFRAYKAEVIIELQKRYGAEILECTGFECMVELLKKIMLCGFTISEVPMKLDTSARAGKSKMKVLRTVRGYFRVFRRSGRWNVTRSQ